MNPSAQAPVDGLRVVHVRVPRSLLDALDGVAAAQSQESGEPVDRSTLIRRAIREFLTRASER